MKSKSLHKSTFYMKNIKHCSFMLVHFALSYIVHHVELLFCCFCSRVSGGNGYLIFLSVALNISAHVVGFMVNILMEAESHSALSADL